jgi:peptidyl-prolyl cis-trans isomerase SurA
MTKFLAQNSPSNVSNLGLQPASGRQYQVFMRMGITASILGALIGSGLAHAQNNAKAKPVDFIVAVVNSEPITNNEVQNLKLRLEKQLQPGKPALSSQVLTQQALDQLINEKSQLQQARDNGIRIDDTEVDQTELNIARQNQVSKEELYKRVALEGLSVNAFREQLRTQLMISRLREREVDNRARISDTDVEQYIQNQPAGKSVASNQLDINLAMILIAVPENGTDKEVADLKIKAQEISQRAKAGESFKALAQAFSQALDKGANGGEMGLRSADRYPTLFIESTQNLSKGDVTDPVRSGAGFHILKVLEKKQSDMSSVMIVQTRARHILLRLGNEMSEAAARNRLLTYKQRIQAGTDFAELAQQFSQDGSAQAGGDLGWASPGQFVPEFEEVMERLRPGQISDPLISRFGVHLIQVMERREVPLSIREQREMVRTQLREKKIEELYSAWVEELRGRAYVELRDPPQ